MSVVSEAALAALQERDDIERLKAVEEAKAKIRQAMDTREKRIQGAYELLARSILPKIFPEAEWVRTDANEDGTTLYVHEKGDPSILFRITTASGPWVNTYIDYTDRWWDGYGYPQSQDRSILINTPLDVGIYIRRASEIEEESARRFYV